MWNSIITFVIQGLSKLVAPVLFYLMGKKNKQSKTDKADAQILERQRDNNINSSDDADSFWVRARKRYKRK